MVTVPGLSAAARGGPGRAGPPAAGGVGRAPARGWERSPFRVRVLLEGWLGREGSKKGWGREEGPGRDGGCGEMGERERDRKCEKEPGGRSGRAGGGERKSERERKESEREREKEKNR